MYVFHTQHCLVLPSFHGSRVTISLALGMQSAAEARAATAPVSNGITFVGAVSNVSLYTTSYGVHALPLNLNIERKMCCFFDPILSPTSASCLWVSGYGRTIGCPLHTLGYCYIEGSALAGGFRAAGVLPFVLVMRALFHARSECSIPE